MLKRICFQSRKGKKLSFCALLSHSFSIFALTAISDIDWSQSIADIDKQLYRKYKLDEDEIEFIEKMINPSRCSKNESCIYYRYNKPVTYARGFTNFQKRMFPDQYSRFMSICINHWSRNTYFERRRGDRSLPPNEQAFILNALKKVGVTEDMKFDSYEENISWYD